jgi:HAD superfamily hydrolase (TIGR01549 family)
MSSINLISDFYPYCSSHSHVSFDLFDTLLRRKYLKVNEVHDTVSTYALSLLGRRHDSSPFDLTLLRYRMGDALKRFDGTGTQEPLVDTIWDRILAKHVTDPVRRAELVDRIVDFEMAIELRNLALVEGARDLLLRLRADGKVVTAISDMYFDLARMRTILDRLGILDLFDHVYVSADSRLTKQTGDLFCKVLDDLGLHSSQLLHIGDNHHSDIKMASQLGIRCILVDQPQSLKLERPQYGQRARIEQEVADLVKVHLSSILFDSLDRRVDHLYFLARDGCAIHDCLRAWDDPLVREFLPAPASSDLYMNRVLSCWGGVDFAGDWLVQAIGLVFWLNHGEASAEEMCAQLGVTEAVPELGTGTLRADRDTFRVAEAFTAAGLKDTIRATIEHKRGEVIRHLGDIGFFNDRTVAFSDVGYSGTVLRDLNSLFVATAGSGDGLAPPAMHLHLISTNDNYVANRPRAYPFVQFSPQAVLPSAQLPESLRASYSWLELFFKHRTLKPILRFVERDGGLYPELRHDEPLPGPTPTERMIASAGGQEEDIVLLWMGAVGYHGPLVDPVIARFANPDLETIAQMEDEVFELHSVQGTRRSIVLRIPGAREEAITLAARENDYWIPGSLVASQAAAAEPAAADLPAGRPRRPGRLLRLIRRKPEPADAPPIDPSAGFDPRFYRSFYPDLRQFHTDQALWEHYFVHGRRERRFANYDALLAQLVAECGPVPDDFSPDGYLRLNGDLAGHIDAPEQALDHYMRLGRHEGRRYQEARHTLEQDFRAMLADGVITLSPAEEREHARGVPVLDIVLQRHAVRRGPWIDEIDVAEFRALHSGWAGPVQNKAQCILALLQSGMPHQPALSLLWPFDAAFYRTQLAHDGAGIAEDDLYRHYLAQGSRRGLVPSEAAALRRIWGQIEFPAGFDWEGYARSVGLPQDAGGRVEVLRRFVDTPGIGRVKFLHGAEAARLIEFIAGRAWHVHGNAQEAARLYEAALASSPRTGAIRHQLADLTMQAGQPAEALRHYRKGIASGAGDRWSFINAASLLLDLGDHAAALAILRDSEEQWQQRAPWRRLRDRALQARSRAVLRAIAMDAPGSGGPDAGALAEADALQREIAATLPARRVLPTRGTGVLVLTMRAVSTAPADRRLLGDVTVYDLPSIEQGEYLAAMLVHDTVIFHEVPFTAEVLRAIAMAKALGRRTISWLGDLTEWQGHRLHECEWDEAGANPSPLSVNQLVDLCLPARYCDEAVTSLAGVLPLLESVAPAAALRLLAPAPRRPDAGTATRRLVIVLPLRELQAPDIQALADALRDAAMLDPGLHFLIDRRLADSRPLQALPQRWDQLDDSLSLPDLAATLDLCNAAVQVVRNPALEYAGWQEAAARGVPALVLRPFTQAHGSGAHRQAHPQHAAWPHDLPAISLGAPAEVARAIVAAAAGEALLPARHEPAVVAAPAGAAGDMAMPSPRKRVLFANVFFAPQTIGGATRVLKDNIDFCLDHHADAFDLAVFCADEQNDRAGEWRLDTYRDTPVFRVATPQELNMDWRADNAMVAARFTAVLKAFRPDLVHIHCLQRLGVRLAEICRDLGIPYVVTLHDAWWLSDYPFLTDGSGCPVTVEADFRAQDMLPDVAPDLSLRRAGRLREALLNARECLAVSESFAQLYRACGIPCRVVENGTSRIDPMPRAVPGDGKVHLCHVGGLEHHKGAYLIETALRRGAFANLHLTIVDLARGRGEETHAVWGSTSVTVTGKMSTAELARFYARMNVLLAPSTWPESYGLVTREALAHGLWIVAGDLGAIGDPVVPGVNGFVVPISDAQGLEHAFGIMDAAPQTYRHPPAPTTLRLVDEQSADLVALYHSVLDPAA